MSAASRIREQNRGTQPVSKHYNTNGIKWLFNRSTIDWLEIVYDYVQLSWKSCNHQDTETDTKRLYCEYLEMLDYQEWEKVVGFFNLHLYGVKGEQMYDGLRERLSSEDMNAIQEFLNRHPELRIPEQFKKEHTFELEIYQNVNGKGVKVYSGPV